MDISKAINILADSVYDLKEKEDTIPFNVETIQLTFMGMSSLDGDAQVLNQR